MAVKRHRMFVVVFMVLFFVLFNADFIVHLQAQKPTATPVTLFRNVRVLSKEGMLSSPANVLVRGNIIERISTSPIPTDGSENMKVIEGKGRTLMPGLIDAHTHIVMQSVPMSVAMTADIGYLNLVAGKAANDMLLRGFTTIRDLGGPSFGLKLAIDQGLTPGPRIYPSGAFISQTSGHGDFRMPYEIPRTIGGPLSHSEQMGAAAIADSPDEVRLRAREQLMKGATQIKLMAGGGVASPYDPLDVAQYTEAEFRAAVEAAENWGTYVTVHAYTPKAIRTAIAGGVKCIEHGQLADEATAELMAEKGIWWSLQPFLDDEDANPQPPGFDKPPEAARNVSGNRHSVSACKEIQSQDGMGNRHTV
jgi:imidazolonepropionase-like amidohydrolase